MRGRRGLLAGGESHPALTAAAAVSVLALGTSVWLATVPVSISVNSLSDPARFGGDRMPGECGAPAAVVARSSLFPPAGEPGTADERELERRRQACLQLAGQRVTAAWELLAVVALIGVWGAAEAATRRAAVDRSEVTDARTPV